MNKKQKKLWIVVIVAICIAAVGAGLFIWKISHQRDTSQVLALGNKYLTELDYEAAVKEYSQVLSVEPMNREAKRGLAMSYIGMGKSEMAQKIIRENVYLQKDNDVKEQMEELFEENPEAEIVMESDVSYSYASKDNLNLMIQDGKVYVKGSNALGALGNEDGFASDKEITEYVSAGFDGNARSVFSTGSVSAIIDHAGRLWFAGSNRSGQQGNGETNLIAQKGWQQAANLNNVCKVAGVCDTSFVLTLDGTLYMAGNNAGYIGGETWVNTWTKVTGYGTVKDIQCTDSKIAFLTQNGNLYMMTLPENLDGVMERQNWKLVASQVNGFALNSQYLMFFDRQNTLLGQKDLLSFPAEWKLTDGLNTYVGARADFQLQAVALGKQLPYLLDTNGYVHKIESGKDVLLEEEGKFVNIYTTEDGCIGQKADATYTIFDN